MQHDMNSDKQFGCNWSRLQHDPSLLSFCSSRRGNSLHSWCSWESQSNMQHPKTLPGMPVPGSGLSAGEVHGCLDKPSGEEKFWSCWKLKTISPPGLWRSSFLTDLCMMCCCLLIPLLEEVREPPVLQWEEGSCCCCCWVASNAGLCQSNTSEPFEISFGCWMWPCYRDCNDKGNHAKNKVSVIFNIFTDLNTDIF